MALNQREKLYGGLAAALVLLGGGYGLIAKPYWLDKRAKLESDISKVTKQNKSEKELLDNQEKMKAEWENLISRGLVDDEFMSAAQLEDTISDLGRRNRVTIESQKVTRTPALPKTEFKEVRIAVSGSGSSMGIWPFLYALEDSRLPIKIDDVQIRSRKDGMDDLMIEMNISTLVYKPPEVKGAATKPSTRAATAPATARAPATRAATQPEAQGPGPAPGPTLEQLEAQLRARRERDANGGASTQPAVATQAPSPQPSTQPSPTGGVR